MTVPSRMELRAVILLREEYGWSGKVKVSTDANKYENRHNGKREWHSIGQLKSSRFFWNLYFFFFLFSFFEVGKSEKEMKFFKLYLVIFVSFKIFCLNYGSFVLMNR